MVFTREDLKFLQALPWEQKVLKSQAKIMEWHHRNEGKVYISFSGGKDSTVLLHLVRQQFPEVPAVFVNTGLEYPEVVEHARNTENVIEIRPAMNFKAVIEKYGYPVISKDVAMTINAHRRNALWAIERMTGVKRDGTHFKFRDSLYKRWRFLLDAPFKMGDGCCYAMKESPLLKFGNKNKLLPYVGILAAESRRRTDSWLRTGCNSFQGRKAKSIPLAFWTEQDVLRYIDHYKLPIAKVYGEVVKTDKGYKTTGAERTGCMFCLFGCHLEKQPNRIQRMAKTHPKQYEYCLKDCERGGLGLQKVMEFVGIPFESKENQDEKT